MANVKIGSDPEFFVMFDGIIKSVHGMFPGTKQNPYSIGDMESIQIDGTAAEFNVRPSSNYQDFTYSIDRCIAAIMGSLPANAEVSNLASYVYPDVDMKGWPESVSELGCSPDFNALSGIQNPRPELPELGLRSVGGHVSIDCSSDAMDQRRVVIACDYLLGLPSVLECSDTRRREIYGKASAFRHNEKFVEYRTLSNYWIMDKKYTKSVFDRAQKASKFYDEAKFDMLLSIIEPTDVAEAINTGDREVAKEMIQILGEHGL